MRLRESRGPQGGAGLGLVRGWGAACSIHTKGSTLQPETETAGAWAAEVVSKLLQDSRLRRDNVIKHIRGCLQILKELLSVVLEIAAKLQREYPQAYKEK